MENWDPLEVQGPANDEMATAARKREIRNILKSYVGFFDPFCELIQNALDAVDMRETRLKEQGYNKRILITINLKENFLEVMDNGIGFDENQFKTFLTPNFSFKNTRKTRGNKGVGATYLAYGFNHLEAETRTPEFSANAIFRKGKEWVDDEETTISRPHVQTVPDPNPELQSIGRVVSTPVCKFLSVSFGRG